MIAQIRKYKSLAQDAWAPITAAMRRTDRTRTSGILSPAAKLALNATMNEGDVAATSVMLKRAVTLCGTSALHT